MLASGAIAQPLGAAASPVKQQRNTTFPVLRRIAMLRREDVHDSDGPAREILQRRGQRASTRKDFTFALGIAAFPNGSNFAPKDIRVRNSRFLKGRQFGAGEIGF